MPQPIATWNPARGVWETDRTSLLCGHSEPYSPTWPTSGTTRHGVAYPLPPWEPRTPATASSSLLPTPQANLGSNGGSQHPDKRRAGGHSVSLDDVASHLLPTPTASPYGSNQSASDGAAVRPSLDSLAPLLPTPKATDSRRGVSEAETRRNDPSLTAIEFLLLPTPKASDGTKGGPNQRGSKGDLTLPSAASRLRPGGASTSSPSADGNR